MDEELIKFLLRDEELRSAREQYDNLDIYSWIASKLFGVSYNKCCEFTKSGKPNLAGKKRRMVAKNLVLAFYSGDFSYITNLLKTPERHPREKSTPEIQDNSQSKEEIKVDKTECNVIDDVVDEKKVEDNKEQKVDAHDDNCDAWTYGIKMIAEELKKRNESKQLKSQLDDIETKINQERERTSKAYELVMLLKKYDKLENHEFRFPEYILNCNPFELITVQLNGYLEVAKNILYRQRDFDMGYNLAVREFNRKHIFRKMKEREIL